MNHKPSTIEKIARIMIALILVLAGFVGIFLQIPTAYAFPEWRESQDNTANGYGWTVSSSSNTNDPTGALVANTTCAGGNDITEVLENGEVIYDLGALYYVDILETDGLDTGTAQVSVDGGSWDTIWSGNLNFGGACDIVQSSIGVEGVGGQVRYIRYLGVAGHTFYLNFFGVHIISLAATPTPTPSPSPVPATPFPPQPTACVTAMPSATATRQASPTPLIQRTATPTRTPTPGGPTATPGPTATGTPLPSFDSGVATFAQSLQPWTATEHFQFGGLYVTEWRSTNGPDGSPGVAFTKDFVGLLDNPSGPLTTTEPLSGSLTFSRPGGMFFPFRVTGSVKWSASILGGESAYLRVWYYDPDYISAGQGAWVTDPPNWRDQFSSDWSNFSFSLTQHGGSGRVTAVAISEELDGTERSGEGALLDNLRVYSGPQAVAGSFPVCQGTGGTGPRPVETKFCNIKQIMTDVYATCKAPDGFDVAGWLAYLYCRLVIYFQFLPQNRQQITDLIARQNADEPFGTFIEVSNITAVIGDMFSSISSTYGANAVTYRTVDWSTLFNFRQLDDIVTLLHIPNDPGVVERYRSRCPVLSDDSMNSQLFRNYGCLMIVFTRDQIPFFGAWQWVIDISSIIGLVIYAKSVLFKTQK